jgi:hypothetical protein
MVQRVPATHTMASRVGPRRTQTMETASTVGPVTPCRPNSHRRQVGSIRSANGSHPQSYRHVPLSPLLALGCIHLSAGSAVKIVLTWCCRYPNHGHAGRRRPRQCALGQLNLGRKALSQGNPSPSTARAVVGPCLQQGQLAVQQDMAFAPITRQQDADLAVPSRTRGAAVLAGYTRRIAALLEGADFIEDQHRVRIPQDARSNRGAVRYAPRRAPERVGRSICCRP